MLVMADLQARAGDEGQPLGRGQRPDVAPIASFFECIVRGCGRGEIGIGKSRRRRCVRRDVVDECKRAPGCNMRCTSLTNFATLEK